MSRGLHIPWTHLSEGASWTPATRVNLLQHFTASTEAIRTLSTSPGFTRSRPFPRRTLRLQLSSDGPLPRSGVIDFIESPGTSDIHCNSHQSRTLAVWLRSNRRWHQRLLAYRAYRPNRIYDAFSVKFIESLSIFVSLDCSAIERRVGHVDCRCLAILYYGTISTRGCKVPISFSFSFRFYSFTCDSESTFSAQRLRISVRTRQAKIGNAYYCKYKAVSLRDASCSEKIKISLISFANPFKTHCPYPIVDREIDKEGSTHLYADCVVSGG
jgi:hypothetical protein